MGDSPGAIAGSRIRSPWRRSPSGNGTATSSWPHEARGRLPPGIARGHHHCTYASLPAIHRLDTKCRQACQGAPPACSVDLPMTGVLSFHSADESGRHAIGSRSLCANSPADVLSRWASSSWEAGGQMPRGPQASPPAARGPLGSPDQPAILFKHDQDFKSTSIPSEHRMTQQGALSTGKGGKRRAAEDSAGRRYRQADACLLAPPLI